MRLLATKKLDFHFKQRLLQQNFSLLEVPFIKTEPIPYTPIQPEKNILVTSLNAARLFLQSHPLDTLASDTQFFCVGEKTAQFLATQQAKIVEVADQAQSLAESLLTKYKFKKYSYACGQKRLPLLENKLLKKGIGVTLHKLYDTLLTPQKITSTLDGILFYSPSAVHSFFHKNTIEKEHCFCIGPTTATAVKPYTSQYSIAKKPHNNYLFFDIRKHYAT